VLNDVQRVTVKSLLGSVYLESANVMDSRVVAERGAIAVNAHGHVTGVRILADDLAALYASGTINATNVTSVNNGVSVIGINGVIGRFESFDPTEGTGNVAVTSHNGISGTIKSVAGVVRTSVYGDQNAIVTAGLRSIMNVWGNINGEITTGGITAFARKDISSTITLNAGASALAQSVSTAELVAGGKVDGSVTDATNRTQYATVRALGDVTGNVKIKGQIYVLANNVSGDIESTSRGINIHAAGNVTGNVHAVSDVNIFVGHNITVPGGAGNSGRSDDQAPVSSKQGSVRLAAMGTIMAGVSAGKTIDALAGREITSTSGHAGTGGSFIAFGVVSEATLESDSGDVFVFAGGSLSGSFTTRSGGVRALALSDLTGIFSGSEEVDVTSYGSVDSAQLSGDSVYLFGLQQADGILNGRSAASIESSYNVLGTVNAAVAVAVAGYDSTVNLDSSRSSTVVAGGSVSGIIESNGTASAISASRGSTEGGVSARVEGKVSAESITLGGSVSGLVKSTLGSAFAFAGKNVTSTIDGKTSATAIAILDVSGGEVKSIGPVRAFAYGNVGSKVSSESATAFSIAGNNITGNVRASKNAIVAAVSGTVSGTVSSTDGSSIVIGMDGISGTITSHRHSVALSSGAISSSVTANNGTAIVASLGGEVTGDVDAADYAIVVAFDEVSGNVSADKSIVVVSLADVSGEIDAEEYAVVLAGGNVSAPVTAWNGVLVASLGNVTGSVTAENGSAIVLALGNVTNSVTATGLVAIIALGDVTVTVAQSQDAIVISGGKTEFKPVAPENSAEAFDPSQPGGTASRDFVISGLGNVRGNVQSGRDLVLVSMGSVSSNVSSQGDAVIYAFDGFFSPIPEQLPTVTAAGDAILITAGRGSAEVTAGKNAVIVSLGSAANSVVTGGELAAVITLGSGNNLSISGRTAALASTYGDFSGSVTSSEGVAVVATIGDAFDADIHGALSAVAVTVGSFDGTVTADEEDAGIISLLNANGEVHAGRSALVLSDGIVNTTVTAGEDLLIWARGDVHGSYHAGRDAAVISHGAWDAELRADRDVVFVYGRDSVRGSITAGRWIGDGSQSVPSDPTLIDDVFSRGEILAQILAGTSASSDPDKGRIGTIGAIGDVAGVISAKEIGRIRSGGAVTASLNVNGTAFDAGNAGTAGTVIQQNQSNLATLVPEPVLDPSARDEILADEAAERDAANTQRDQIAIELDASKLVVNTLRQQILNELAEDREAIRSAVDLVKILADLAVAAAQQAEAGKLTETRQYIETLYQKREAGYLKQQQDWEQVVQNAQSILEEAAREWNDLRLKAQSALEQGDQDQLRFRNLALAREQERLREHIDRWKRDLDDLRNRGSSIDGAILLDRIQLALDIFGFVPVLGAGPDAINAIISAGRGNWGDAAINLVAIIPFWGDGAKAGKMLAKAGQEGVQHVDEVGAVVNAVAKNGDSIKLLDKAIDSWCFSPDTLVAAESGKKAIREIEPGERVFAYDYGAGRFVLADVLQRHENLYSGPWVTFSANGENIALTANHPIWVVDGDGLSDRAAPEHLDIREDEGKSLVGRWINSQDLRVGDVLLSRTGGNLVIERVEVSDSVNAPVCNLTVRDYHTFLVGADELLAHNLSWCELLEKKWGREKPQELIELAEKYGYDLKYIHGHHIVMKGANDIWSAGAREILEEYGIKVIYNQTQLAAASKDELFNLAFALNNHRGIHSNAYAKAVWERLKKVVDEGLADELSKSEIADGLKDALQKMREILEKGDIFWPGY